MAETTINTIQVGAVTTAEELPFDNTASGLTATNTQAAIDEVEARLDTAEASTHDAVTLNAGTATQQSANLAGQEIELVEATGTTAGVMPAADKAKTDFITVTQAVDLDTIETDTATAVAHAGTTSGNPHSVDLQDAYDDGNTIAPTISGDGGLSAITSEDLTGQSVPDVLTVGALSGGKARNIIGAVIFNGETTEAIMAAATQGTTSEAPTVLEAFNNATTPSGSISRNVFSVVNGTGGTFTGAAEAIAEIENQNAAVGLPCLKFNQAGTGADIRLSDTAGDATTIADGDIWYNSTSDKIRVRAGGSTETVDFERALTGDVTASAGSGATTIANNAVTNAKSADMAANTVKANNTGSAGDPVDMAVAASRIVGRGSTGNVTALTVGASLAISGTEVQRAALTGDVTAAANGNATTIANSAVTLAKMANGVAGNLISYNGSGNPAAVATGNSGQVLTSNGAGNAPTFQARIPANLRVLVSAGPTINATTANDAIMVDNTATTTVNLPTAVGNEGKVFYIKKRSASGGSRNVVLDPFGSQTIDGVTTVTMNSENESRTIVSDGSNWSVI